MNLLLLLDMAAAARPDAVAVEAGGRSLTYAELLAAAWGAATELEAIDGLAYLGTNGLGVPVALFGAAAAGVPYVPLNYRLPADQLDGMLARLGDLRVVRDDEAAGFVERAAARGGSGDVPTDGDGVAVLLHTSGTTAAPKAAVLRHRHLTAYIIGSVEFAAAGDDEAALVSVPPYHVAGVANLLSNVYLGRRVVYLPQFDAAAWVDAVRRHGITHAMVVPTMLARICDVLEAGDPGLPTLRALSYGGSRTPAAVLERVLRLLPGVDLTNAYGLTETSSTIAVLGPDDHRDGRHLGSVGRVLPGIEVDIRDGEIWVRGEQVSGEYAGLDAPLDAGGWFPTRDRGWVDDDGYLYVEGRGDDTIIRGGENIAPAEVEEVLLRHPGVRECAVVGVPDEEWGQRIAAAVVGPGVDPDELRAFARQHLRSSKTPDVIVLVDELPYTDTGKLLRRVVQDKLVS